MGELKIQDIGDNILLFEFEDNLDLKRVLEYEPWTFDKHSDFREGLNSGRNPIFRVLTGHFLGAIS